MKRFFATAGVEFACLSVEKILATENQANGPIGTFVDNLEQDCYRIDNED